MRLITLQFFFYMFNNKLKNISTVAVMALITLGFSISLQSLLASWTAPSAIAPNNNVTTPLNVGNVGQSKNAGLIINAGAISENGLIVQSGKVGIGTISPASKFDVNGEIRVGNTGLACSATTSGVIRYNGSDFEGCKNGSWVSLTSGTVVLTGASSTVALYGGVHTEGDCYQKGGSMVTATDGTSKFCKMPVASCPTGWTKFLDSGVGWSETRSSFYPGGETYADMCIGENTYGYTCYKTTLPCSTGYHVWQRGEWLESCSSVGSPTVYYATYSYRGCY